MKQIQTNINKEVECSLERRKNKGKKEKGGQRRMNEIKILALLRTLLDLINPIVFKQNQVFFVPPVQSVFITTDHLVHLFLFGFLPR